MERVYLNVLNCIGLQVMLTLQRNRRFDGRLRPPANRVRFEILLVDSPAFSQIRPDWSDTGFFHCKGRYARETIRREIRRADARHRAPTGPIFHHRRMIYDPQDLAAAPIVSPDA